ncbi:hypothetical protein [Pelagibaculum spongiae]|uniref:Uncharacterized protein n=1 Tax=Pelagibaculum spongiae TaxID=2080658 RepID=A0A2V1GV41_9GAMM|nr:hypothetical protein [Pelagibaculum spongiae]PVZ62961.1 hypothetical protein DC094_21580 [Pelagibaculum spongiae]
MIEIKSLGAGLLLLFSISATAGVFISANPSQPTRITHPMGYTGQGGVVTLTVSFDDAELSDPDRFEATLINTLNHYTRLTWSNNNAQLDASLPFGHDLQAVLLQLFGFSQGLTSSADGYFTVAGAGADGMLNRSKGPDSRSGSHDDIRGDDVNYFWFERGRNNPFAAPEIADSSTMSVDLEHLPSSHSFASNANESVSRGGGYGQYTSSVMFDPLPNNFTRRRLAADDANTLRLARSGIDRIANTEDDYRVRFNFVGRNQPADIRIRTASIDNAISRFSYSKRQLAADTDVLVSVTVAVEENVNWYYDTEPTNTAPQITIADDSGLNPQAAQLVRTIDLTAVDLELDDVSWAVSSQVMSEAASLDLSTGNQVTLTYQVPETFRSIDQITVVATDFLGLSQILSIPVDASALPPYIPPEDTSETPFQTSISGAGVIWSGGLVMLGVLLFRRKFKK